MLADLKPRTVRLLGVTRSHISNKGGVRVGKRFGKWTVEAFSCYDERLQVNKWRCLCDCGTQRDVAAAGLMSGRSQSCGCLGKARRFAGWEAYIKRRRLAR